MFCLSPPCAVVPDGFQHILTFHSSSMAKESQLNSHCCNICLGGEIQPQAQAVAPYLLKARTKGIKTHYNPKTPMGKTGHRLPGFVAVQPQLQLTWYESRGVGIVLTHQWTHFTGAVRSCGCSEPPHAVQGMGQLCRRGNVPLLCRGMAQASVTKSQCSAKGFSWVSALPAKEFSSIPNTPVHQPSLHTRNYLSQMRKTRATRRWIQQLNPVMPTDG